MQGKVEIKIPGWVYEKLKELAQQQNKTVRKILNEIIIKRTYGNSS